MTLCMLRFWLAGAAVFAVLAMMGCGRQAESTAPGTPTSRLAETPTGKGVRPAGGAATEPVGEIPTISAMELTQALNKDKAAGKRYAGKVVRIEGIVESVDLKPKDPDSGVAKVQLRGTPYELDENDPWTVDCILIDKPGANKLGSGQKVTLQGTYLREVFRSVSIVKATVVTAEPVAITQAEIERLRKEEPKAIAALKKMGVKCGEDPSPVAKGALFVNLTDNELTPDGEIKPEVLAPMAQLVSPCGLALSDTRISDAGLAGLKKLVHLQDLFLDRTKIGDAGLAHLKDVSRLRALRVSGRNSSSSLITDVGLASLAGLRNLKFLDLPESHINGTGLKHLKGLRKLTSLNLSGCPVVDEGLETLAMLPKLDWLYLSGTKVGDAGMGFLAKSPSLWGLELRNTVVGDGGLAHLAGLKTLQVLELSQKSKATSEGIKKLKAVRPELKVSLGG